MLGKVSVQSLQHWCSLDVVLQIIKSLIKLIGLIAVVYILLWFIGNLLLSKRCTRSVADVSPLRQESAHHTSQAPKHHNRRPSGRRLLDVRSPLLPCSSIGPVDIQGVPLRSQESLQSVQHVRAHRHVDAATRSDCGQDERTSKLHLYCKYVKSYRPHHRRLWQKKSRSEIIKTLFEQTQAMSQYIDLHSASPVQHGTPGSSESVVSSVTGRQLRKHIPPKWHQHASGPSGMLSSMFPLAVLSIVFLLLAPVLWLFYHSKK